MARFAALVALDAPPPSYLVHLGPVEEFDIGESRATGGRTAPPMASDEQQR